jgi:NAD+ dependent glucose-6-phosphate dehydrogenase
MSLGGCRFVLLTGAAGRIGTAFRQAYGERYRFRLADLQREGLADTPGTDHEILRLDIADADACRAACEGIDTVHDAGCRRVVFASSVHAVADYPPDVTIADDAPPRPINLYGASKVFGEAVASTFASRGLSAIAVRIGAYDAPWFHERGGPSDAIAYVSARDLNDLLLRCVETPDIRYAVAAGISNNARKRFDLVQTRRLLGYSPRDDGFAVLAGDRP